MAIAKMPIPDFFNIKNAADFNYSPDSPTLFEQAGDWRSKNNIKSSGALDKNVHCLIIDQQKDFCFPEGSLYVAGRSGTGAIDDSGRISKFIYEHIHVIKKITVTLDTHFPFQIFFSSFWIDSEGNPLSPHTLVCLDDSGNLVNKGLDGSVLHENIKPNPAVAWWVCNGNYGWLQKQVKHYCEELAKAGRYTLYLWPPHCLLGSDGHVLAGVVQEARMFHSYVTASPAEVEVKGGNYLTENYSVLGPEVTTRFDGKPLAQKNTRFISTLFISDAIIIAGEALSHCVKSTIGHLLSEIVKHDKNLAKKVYILKDCTSAVVVPGADFTDDGEKALEEFADAGMNIVDTETAIQDWPGFPV